MLELPTITISLGNIIAQKYCGGGYGGYALYLCNSKIARDLLCETFENFIPVEPFIRL